MFYTTTTTTIDTLAFLISYLDLQRVLDRKSSVEFVLLDRPTHNTYIVEDSRRRPTIPIVLLQTIWLQIVRELNDKAIEDSII